MAFDMAHFAREWPRQQARWRRFAEWEADWEREHPTPLARRLMWISEAWDLARRHDPGWNSIERAPDHWQELARARRRLAVIRDS